MNQPTPCHCCPRGCRRSGTQGAFCHADAGMPEAAAVYAHTGEEPPLSGQRGISNIFFAHCNLQCCYCQNHEISGALVTPERVTLRGVDAIVDATAESLKHTEQLVGLVSATHYADSIPAIVDGLHARGLYPTIVYNTGGYDTVDTLQRLAPYIDVYLPDFKYADPVLAQRYSHAADYPQRAGAALREMVNQKGTALPTDDNGLAFRGIIVRHLVLPGQSDNSIQCLQWIADNISTNLHISLMAQYFPPEGKKLPDELGRRLREEEYQRVVDAFYDLGFHRGWVQPLDAADNYKPHFEHQTLFK